VRRLRLAPSLAIYEPGFLQTVLAYHARSVCRAVRWSSSTSAALRPDRYPPGLHLPVCADRHALLAYLDMLEGTACRGRSASGAAI